MNNQPIFIVGASRSGNTLIRMILTSHSMICIPPESRFLHYLDTIFHSNSEKRKEALLIKLTSDKKFADWGIDKQTLNEYIKQSLSQSYSDFIAGIYLLYLKKENRANAQWGDKNPMYVFKINRILELFPYAYIILLVREPLSIFGSLKRVKFFGRDMEAAMNDYYQRIRCVAHAITEYQNLSNVIMVNYAGFVGDPEINTRNLIKRLGYAFEPSMLEFHNNKSFIDQMLHSKVRFHENLLKPINSSFIKPDSYDLYPNEVNKIEKHLINELKIIRSFIDSNPSL